MSLLLSITVWPFRNTLLFPGTCFFGCAQNRARNPNDEILIVFTRDRAVIDSDTVTLYGHTVTRADEDLVFRRFSMCLEKERE